MGGEQAALEPSQFQAGDQVHSNGTIWTTDTLQQGNICTIKDFIAYFTILSDSVSVISNRYLSDNLSGSGKSTVEFYKMISESFTKFHTLK